MTRKLRVAVLAGGRSSEHEISVASAASVAAALDPARYETTTIEISRDGRWRLGPTLAEAIPSSGVEPAVETLPVVADSPPAEALGRIDVVLPILHGPFGEDGTVQGLLELAGIPYVGAGVAASALCMDKDLFKAVLRDRGIAVARNVTLRDGDPVRHDFPYPVFVKPARLGSSVGITKVHDESELETAVELARRHDDKVLIEELVPGTEVECGVLGNRHPIASAVGEIVAHAEWYDYSAKYDEGGMDLIVPARVPEDVIERVRRVGGRVVRGDRMRGDGAGRPVRPPGRRGDRQRAEHDPRVHGDERVREALRGFGNPVRRAPRSPDRARARATRPALAAPVLMSQRCSERPQGPKRPSSGIGRNRVRGADSFD